MADALTLTAGGVTYNIKDAAARAALENIVLTLTLGSFSTFPQTVSDVRITADMVVLSCQFSNAAAIKSDVSWQTSAGQISLSGTISGTTTATITLGKSSF